MVNGYMQTTHIFNHYVYERSHNSSLCPHQFHRELVLTEAQGKNATEIRCPE